jgi:sugar lactone lactonase YvrE
VRVVGEDGQGVFRLAQALALSPDGGRVYVGDSGSYRIQVFTRDGLFLRQFGRYGTGAGEIETVGGIATDAQGRVDVLDSSNDRVEVFTPDGAYLGAWGTSGTGPGQFDLGTNGGIAVNGANAYVADQDNARVEKFALDPVTGLPDGSTPLAWGSFGDCATACTLLSLNHPQGVAVSGSDVFVADDDNHRVVKYSDTGTPEGAIDAAGELGYPYDVGVDSTHALYVVDDCDPSLVPVCTYTTGDRTDLTHQRVRKYDAASLAFLSTWGVFGDQPGQFEFPRAAAAVSADPNGGVYVADAANNRVQSFDATGKFQRKWGISGRGASYLATPEGIAADAHGNLYVADAGNDRVQEFDSDGRYLGEWGRLGTTGYPASGTGLGAFSNPWGIAVGADGTTYVADTSNNRLQARDPVTGAWRQITGQTLSAPRGVAIAGGKLYVADSSNNAVRVLDLASGTWTGLSGTTFRSPRGVAINAAGDVFVADTTNNRVQELHGGTWSAIGVGVLSRPVGVAIDGDGIIVTDTGHDRLVTFAADGAMTGAWGNRGTDPGQFDGPAGIAVDANGRVLVDDVFNNRVQLFSPAPAPTPTTTVPPVVVPARVAPGPQPQPVEPLGITVTRTGSRRAGLTLQLACTRACLANVRLLISHRDARRLGVSATQLDTTVGSPTVLHVRFRAPVRRAARLRIRLLVSVFGAAGGHTGIDRTL